MNLQKNYTIDFSGVKHYFEMHFAIRDSLDLPHYYGCNWDALWDCLTDLAGTPMRIRIVGLEAIQRNSFDDSAKIFIEILKRLKHYENDAYADKILIEIIDGKTGKKTILT